MTDCLNFKIITNEPTVQDKTWNSSNRMKAYRLKELINQFRTITWQYKLTCLTELYGSVCPTSGFFRISLLIITSKCLSRSVFKPDPAIPSVMTQVLPYNNYLIWYYRKTCMTTLESLKMSWQYIYIFYFLNASIF